MYIIFNGIGTFCFGVGRKAALRDTFVTAAARNLSAKSYYTTVAILAAAGLFIRS
jgi:hypothetical protein